MFHFIINYLVTIDGAHTENGLIGSASPDNDHRPNYVKQTIQEQYRKRNPEAKSIAVVLQHIEPVSAEDYNRQTGIFLNLI